MHLDHVDGVDDEPKTSSPNLADREGFLDLDRKLRRSASNVNAAILYASLCRCQLSAYGGHGLCPCFEFQSRTLRHGA